MKVVRFVRFTCVIIYTEESVDVPQTCTFIEVISNFLSPVRGLCRESEPPLRPAPPFTKLLKIFREGHSEWGAFCVEKQKRVVLN